MNDTTAVPRVSLARYAAPPVRITPVTEVVSSEAIKGRKPPGHYQQLLLDTRTGELRFHESNEHLEPWNAAWKAMNDVPRETWQRWHPGTLFSSGGPHMWFKPVPELLGWMIDSGVSDLPYLNVAAANALLKEVAASAQALLDGLFEAGGELDWSADSARAGRNIVRLCGRSRRYRQTASPEVDADLVDYAEIVRRFPQAYRPELLGLSLDKLADRCESITRCLGSNEHWHPEIRKVYGAPSADGTRVDLEVLGVRAWYRTVLLNGDPRPLRDFGGWDAEHGRLDAGEITSTTTDTELDAWASREETRAAQIGVRLLGALDAAREHRARLREQDWDHLAVVGAEVARLERELAEARSARLELITKAISWGQADAAIADRARMTRQAVHKIRTNSERTDDAG